MFQSLFANSFAFCSFASESVWSAPAATPFTSAKRSASAPNCSMKPSGLMTLPVDLLIFSPSTRTRPWRYTVWNGMSPISSMPIMIMRATQKNRMS